MASRIVANLSRRLYIKDIELLRNCSSNRSGTKKTHTLRKDRSSGCNGSIISSLPLLKFGVATYSSSCSQSVDDQVKPVESQSPKEVKNILTPGEVSKYFEFSSALNSSEESRNELVSTMLVYPDFVTPEEEELLMKEIEPYISRLHYEKSHWDDAIHEYRETERSRWNKKNEPIIDRIRSLAFPPGTPQLKLVHILDLAKKGLIKPHIDSIKFCGNTIAGLSLLSDSIMRLRHDVEKDFHCDIYLPRYSLYVMKNYARYEFTHEILGEKDSTFRNAVVLRDRRISIMCRNEPEIQPGSIFTPVV